MTLDEVMSQLKAQRNEAVYKHNAKHGAGDNQFGVKTGDIKAVAKAIKSDPALASELWKTGNADAMLLATLIMKPKQLSMEEVEAMVRSVSYSHVADWLNSNVVKMHPQKEELRQKWMSANDPATTRAAWSLTTERVNKDPSGLDLNGLLDRIDRELGGAVEENAKWTMENPKWTVNYCLASIGIEFPEHRNRAIEIGEKNGAFRDYPTSKGCVSPYVPSWINEMVRRQK
jgi:3-methyladenine DNA glycosylase AlkD